jgi:hypothetical protein
MTTRITIIRKLIYSIRLLESVGTSMVRHGKKEKMINFTWEKEARNYLGDMATLQSHIPLVNLQMDNNDNLPKKKGRTQC